MKKNALIKILSIVGFILFILFIAMQFTNEIAWSANDFIIAFVILSTLGVLIDYILKEHTTKNKKSILIVILIILFILVWIEASVGIF